MQYLPYPPLSTSQTLRSCFQTPSCTWWADDSRDSSMRMWPDRRAGTREDIIIRQMKSGKWREYFPPPFRDRSHRPAWRESLMGKSIFRFYLVFHPSFFYVWIVFFNVNVIGNARRNRITAHAKGERFRWSRALPSYFIGVSLVGDKRPKYHITFSGYSRNFQCEGHRMVSH